MAAPLIGIATCFQLRVYRMVTRFIGPRGFTLSPVAALGLSALYWSLLVYLSGIYSIPRSVIVLYPVLATALIWFSRQAATSLLRGGGVEIPAHPSVRDCAALIYGAGTTGVQLLEACGAPAPTMPVGFIDLNPHAVGPVRCRSQGVSPRAHGRAIVQRTMCGKCCWRCPRPGGRSARPRCGSSSR